MVREAANAQSAEAPPADGVQGFDMANDPRLNAGFLLTGDASIVHLQATFYYQINDPVAWLIAGDHVVPGLERLFIASAVSLCAGRDLDTILVARPEMNQNTNDALRSSREQLRSDLMNGVNRRLDDLAARGAGFGVMVSRVDLVPAIPSDAKKEFDHVLVATQLAEQDIAEARTEAEMIAQQANQRSDSIITDATAGARSRSAMPPVAPPRSRLSLINLSRSTDGCSSTGSISPASEL